MDYSLRELGNDIFPKLLHGTKKECKEMNDLLAKKMRPVMFALEADSHWALMEASGTPYWGMAKELSNQIIKENNCTSHTEKMLVEVIVNAFIRVLKASTDLTTGSVPVGNEITENRTKYIAVISKQLDRANRQYLSALMALKQLKTPSIEMNIKAKTAFISQNQQINAGDSKHENNDAK